jgi:hypothetical protein
MKNFQIIVEKNKYQIVRLDPKALIYRHIEEKKIVYLINHSRDLQNPRTQISFARLRKIKQDKATQCLFLQD